MLRFFPCPQCAAELAYSAALLGRTVRCHHCRQPFALSAPPGDPQPAAAPGGLEPPPLPRTLTPPPLPRRGRPTARPIRPREAEDEWSPPDPPGRSGLGPLVGLMAVFVVGFSVLAVGVGYLLWPQPKPVTAPVNQGVAPPVENPVAIDPPKGLDEILKNAPKTEKDMGPMKKGSRLPGSNR